MSDDVKVPDGYSFLRVISSGGFGSVVEMIENSTQIHYAGKIIPCVTAKDRERIDREVNRLGHFGCDWIVKLKEVVSMDNSKVIVMELGEQSLADIVKDYTSRKVLMPREVVYRVMVDVSSALNFLHNHSSGATAHGDVKMENILVFPGGHFKLCDLGTAEKEDVTSTTSVMSQLYVSPERMESTTGRATCQSDVWALGIVLHWLLFGEPPFKSKNIMKLGQEITSFRVSMIGESCGGEERALLMRMLDPNPVTRVTSSQLCSFGVFRGLVNTPSGVWKLKDVYEEALSNKLDKMGLEHESEKQRLLAEIVRLEKARQELENEKWTQQQRAVEVLKKEREDRKKDRETIMKMSEDRKKDRETIMKMSEDRKKDQADIHRLEKELADLKSRVIQPSTRSTSPADQSIVFLPPPPHPHPHPPPQPPPRPPLPQPRRSQIGAAAIELVNQLDYEISGNIFRKIQNPDSSILSFEFGAVVARLSLTISPGPTNGATVGIVSSNLSNEALAAYFPKLKGGAGWNLEKERRCAGQNKKVTRGRPACLAGRAGQRVVLEADGREGMRTLKLSQDGETQPVFFTNIPVPFRFAVNIWTPEDAVEIESVEVVDEPQMVGGRKSLPMDE
ncbi:putative protein kinase [Blattamonas nauphoetae]|uniref:Protein kinase domain-containing protein n=1 Tax=Blattamonas nauphoetae TaxID=2049346 RepID=A0ABQ9XLT2_9EUKA|nr:putative protein kinase [Blattamonas nauphoetae]